MLTAMTEEDWTIVLRVFAASRSRRGDKGRQTTESFSKLADDSVVYNITWRALPEKFGHWNSAEAVLAAEPIWNFRSVLRCPGGDERDGAFGADVRFTVVRARCLGSGRKRGQHDQALLAARVAVGRRFTEDRLLEPLIAFHLTGGEASDSRNFETLLDIGPDLNPRAALGDKGYDSKSNRDAARQRGICPAIPYRSNTKDMPAFFPKTLYKARARIEQAVGKLKRFKRIALRCEKTARMTARSSRLLSASS